MFRYLKHHDQRKFDSIMMFETLKLVPRTQKCGCTFSWKINGRKHGSERAILGQKNILSLWKWAGTLASFKVSHHEKSVEQLLKNIVLRRLRLEKVKHFM